LDKLPEVRASFCNGTPYGAAADTVKPVSQSPWDTAVHKNLTRKFLTKTSVLRCSLVSRPQHSGTTHSKKKNHWLS